MRCDAKFRWFAAALPWRSASERLDGSAQAATRFSLPADIWSACVGTGIQRLNEANPAGSAACGTSKEARTVVPVQSVAPSSERKLSKFDW